MRHITLDQYGSMGHARGRRQSAAGPMMNLNCRIEPLEGRRLLAAGALDATFGTGGLVTTDFGGRTDVIRTLAAGPDGSVYAAGSTSNSFAANPSDFAVARYDPSGALVSGFGGDGTVQTDFFGAQDDANAIAVQSDGKVVVVGRAFSADGSQSDFAIARYNTDGTLDGTFGTGGLVITDFALMDSATGVAIDADGRILVVGSATSGGANATHLAAARYNADGSLDASYGTQGKVEFQSLPDATGVALLGDGSALVTGRGLDFKLMRLSSSGGLDGSFGSNGVASASFGSNATARALVVQDDGKIVLAGESSLGGPLDTQMAVARFNSDGSQDTSFGVGGVNVKNLTSGIDQANAVGLEPDGRIVLAGFAFSGEGDFGLVRFMPDGTIDNGWGSNGKVTTDFAGSGDSAGAVLIQPDGAVIAAGQATEATTDFGLARYEPGTLDVVVPPFSPGNPAILVDNVTVSEAEAGNAVFTVLLTPAPSQSVTVDYTTVDGTAVAGVNYTAASGTLTFAPGQTQQTISVPIHLDGVAASPDLAFGIQLSNATHGTLFRDAGTATIHQGPAVGSLGAAAASVARRGRIRLIASNVIAGDSGRVRRVFFFVDSNGNGTWDAADRKVGAGRRLASGDWVKGGIGAGRLASGTNRFFALAVDQSGFSSIPASTSVSVLNTPPVIASLDAKPTVFAGQSGTIRLAVRGARDPDGVLRRVEFYQDSNDNGVLDPGDSLLQDSAGPGKRRFVGAFTGSSSGTTRFFAQASDADGSVSNVVTTTVQNGGD